MIGYGVAFFTSVPNALQRLQHGLHPAVLIAHKGMEEHGNNVELLMNGLERIEELQTTRVGFVSGEFFGEVVCQTALRLGADFGWDMTAYGVSHPVPDWVRTIINVGYLHPIEVERRGKEIIISADMAQKRLELLCISSK